MKKSPTFQNRQERKQTIKKKQTLLMFYTFYIFTVTTDFIISGILQANIRMKFKKNKPQNPKTQKSYPKNTVLKKE